jgi:hypothetical protein
MHSGDPKFQAYSEYRAFHLVTERLLAQISGRVRIWASQRLHAGGFSLSPSLSLGLVGPTPSISLWPRAMGSDSSMILSHESVTVLLPVILHVLTGLLAELAMGMLCQSSR